MIREVTIPGALLKRHGLEPNDTTLRDLGPIVLLAGPNGAGKTRFLRSITFMIEAANDWQQNGFGLGGMIDHLMEQSSAGVITAEEQTELDNLLLIHSAYRGLKVEVFPAPNHWIGHKQQFN